LEQDGGGSLMDFYVLYQIQDCWKTFQITWVSEEHLTEEKITKIANDNSSNIHFIPESSSSVSEDNEEGISESSHDLGAARSF
jgi:hypothetical protein